MYLVGAAHANKDAATRLLETAIARGDRLVTDAEVLQEILHRYVAIARRDAIQPAFDIVRSVADVIYPVESVDVDRAKAIVLGARSISARDAVHVAIMQRYGIAKVLSFDGDFDQFPWLKRLH